MATSRVFNAAGCVSGARAAAWRSGAGLRPSVAVAAAAPPAPLASRSPLHSAPGGAIGADGVKGIRGFAAWAPYPALGARRGALAAGGAAASGGQRARALHSHAPAAAAHQSEFSEDVGESGVTLPSNVVLDDLSAEVVAAAAMPALPYADAAVAAEALNPPVLRFAEPGEVAPDAVQLSPVVFGGEVRVDLVHRVVRWQLAKRRTTAYRTKRIGEVSGSGRKPWPQKGTGRARAGHTRPGHWRGGAKAHGPRLRDWAHKLPKKVRKLGLRSALAAKLRERRLVVIDSEALPSARTGDLASLLLAHGWDETRLLVITGDDVDANFELASGNIKRVRALPSRGANVYDILKVDTVLITRDGVDSLTERLGTL